MSSASAAHRVLRRLAGTVAATGLALAGLAVAAAPASAAACSGTSGVTVVVDTGGSISTRCASGDPSSAWGALTAAGFGTTPVQTFPGALCQINGYPDTSCVRMPPASAYWAFFHARAGGSWTYSSSGVASYDPAPGSVVGFAFGSGGQPGIAPPSPPATSKPAPTTTRPKATTAAPEPTSKPATTTSGTSTSGSGKAAGSTTSSGSGATTAPAEPTATTKATASATPSATASASGSASPNGGGPASTEASATPLAAAPTSGPDDSSGPATLLVGGALVALVAGGAGWAAWRRRV
ncbi:MAG TPA: hypothetical protein VLA55_01150 [Ornithinibacter sp.]|nr:hypothetical protein [Ornithinibacter sp.]